MKVKRQIFLGFAIVIISPLISAIWTMRASNLVNKQVARLHNFFPILELTNDIPLQVNALQEAFIETTLVPDDEGIEGCRTLAADLDATISELEQLSGDPEVTRMRTLADAYAREGLSFITVQINGDDEQIYSRGPTIQRAAAELTATVDKFRADINQRFSMSLSEVNDISTNTRFISSLTSLFAFLVGSILAVIFANHFSGQDEKLRMANEELAARYDDLSLTNDLLEKQITKRELVEKKLRRSLGFEEALSQVSGLFAKTHQPDLRQASRVLGQAVNCDITFIVIFEQEGTRVEQQVESVLPESISIRPDHYLLDISEHGPWMQQLTDEGKVIIEDTTRLQSTDEQAREVEQKLNLVSMALIPIHAKQQGLLGYMGYGQFREAREWSPEALRLLRVACEMLSNYQARQQAEERLKYDAFHDSLTGLPNRSLFMDRLGHLIGRLERHPDEEFAVLFLDLDRFKPINDSMGHPIGDQLLIQIALTLQECVRQQDTVARLGGDEFTILLEEIDNLEEVKAVARRIIRQLNQPFMLGGYEVHTSASIGIKVCNNQDKLPDEVVRDADIAMYEAKHRGKARFVIFHESMHRQTTTVVQMEHDLRKGIEHDEFYLCYQPIICFDTGRILGFEALLRWQHPKRGPVSPAEFIPLAEETGLIIPLGRWVIQQAFKQNMLWHQSGFEGLTMSVNVSARQFYDKSLPDTIATILEETGLPAENLNLELTESLLMEHLELNVQMLNQLNEMGISLSVDDFGTGYSSLSYLKRFPIQTLKIDQSFVRDIPTSADDTAITSAIIAMGVSLNLTIIAEGVENEEQFRFLKNKGCHKFQGFLISGPLRAEDASEMLQENYQLG